MAGKTPLNDTWVFADGNWTRRFPATSPPQGPQTVRDIPSLVVEEDDVSVSKASLGVRMAPVQRR